jgi:hypothetical protein
MAETPQVRENIGQNHNGSELNIKNGAAQHKIKRCGKFT